MLIYSMSATADGFIKDRAGEFGWTPPSEELFRFHLEQVSQLGAYLCGRRLYETMRVWETDPSLRSNADRSAFADVWCELPKVVFSRTLTTVTGHARLATASLVDEVAQAVARYGTVSIGGAELAGAALELVDEFRLFRLPIVVGGGTPYFPPLAQPLRLQLMETRKFPEGVVLEKYRAARSAQSLQHHPEK